MRLPNESMQLEKENGQRLSPRHNNTEKLKRRKGAIKGDWRGVTNEVRGKSGEGRGQEEKVGKGEGGLPDPVMLRGSVREDLEGIRLHKKDVGGGHNKSEDRAEGQKPDWNGFRREWKARKQSQWVDKTPLSSFSVK